MCSSTPPVHNPPTTVLARIRPLFLLAITSVPVAQDNPAALKIQLELRFRGSIYANGQGATAWSPNQDIADGMQFLQVDIRLIGNPLTDEVPTLDTLVVPIN